MGKVEADATQKFRVKIDGKWRVVYYINAVPRVVLKIDGEQTYFYYRDIRVDIQTMLPIFPTEGAKREVHETECLSNRTDIP